MFFRCAVIFLVVSIVLTSDILKHAYVDRIHCKSNSVYCTKPICKLAFISRSIKSLTWACNVIKPVDLVNMHVTLYYRYRNGYQTFLIDLNIDICAYYNNTLGSAVMDLVRKEMEQYATNMFRPCPFFGNITLIALPLTLALLNYMFLPSGAYKLAINSTFGEKNLFAFDVLIYFSVPAGRTLEDDNMG